MHLDSNFTEQVYTNYWYQQLYITLYFNCRKKPFRLERLDGFGCFNGLGGFGCLSELDGSVYFDVLGGFGASMALFVEERGFNGLGGFGWSNRTIWDFHWTRRFGCTSGLGWCFGVFQCTRWFRVLQYTRWFRVFQLTEWFGCFCVVLIGMDNGFKVF